MIVGVGVDISQNYRFDNLDDAFLEKIYTEEEIEESKRRERRSEYLSSRFALKEAVAKALSTGFKGIFPKDIESYQDESGKPFVRIKGMSDEYKVHVSISHEREYSVAFAVIEK